MDCSCILLRNGLSDVFGFNHPRKHAVVIKNIGLDPFQLCDSGHRILADECWLISKDAYEGSLLASNRKINVLARFGANQQTLKA